MLGLLWCRHAVGLRLRGMLPSCSGVELLAGRDLFLFERLGDLHSTRDGRCLVKMTIVAVCQMVILLQTAALPP